MPVERYRDVSEMPPPPRPAAAQLLRAMAAVWELALVSLLPDPPRGVFKFRSLEASQRQRQERELEQIRQLRRRRVRQSPGEPTRQGS